MRTDWGVPPASGTGTLHCNTDWQQIVLRHLITARMQRPICLQVADSRRSAPLMPQMTSAAAKKPPERAPQYLGRASKPSVPMIPMPLYSRSQTTVQE